MRLSRPLRYGLLAAVTAGGVLLFLLATTVGNSRTFERNYPILLGINAAIAVALALVVLALIVRLVRRYRQGRFGSRLMARFAVAFALVGVLPGLLIYVVSVQFLSRSIESWFDVRVDRALESGLSLGRGVLDAQLADLAAKGRTMALELADTAPSAQVAALERMRERAGVHEAALLTLGGQVLATSGLAAGELLPDLPSASQLRQVRAQRPVLAIEGEPGATEARAQLRTRVVVATPAGAGGEPLALQLVQRVPANVAANAAELQAGLQDYQELTLARSGLRRIYEATLTLTLLFAALAAVASGVLIAGSMSAPLLQVAAGTRAVAEGDFRPVREFAGSDELNLLTQSFNAMTRQLAEARVAVEAKQRELENARAFLERVLTNLSAGVIVLDGEQRIVTANHGASRILGTALAEHAGRPLAEVSPALADRLREAFDEQALAGRAQEPWQCQIALPRAEGEPLALLARGSPLPLEDGPGGVIVFDDVTEVISAQRALAWGEVARRLAHEIKNPLTPIQLAAERLEMKLAGSLPPAQAEVLARGARTIVNQVGAMKRMVDDFRDYARVPPARLQPLDLNGLVEEVAALWGTEPQAETAGPGAPAEAGGDGARGAAPVALRLAADLPAILGDATQLRQVIHNLLANAQEALAAPPAGAAPPTVTVRTEVATLDDGGGARARGVRLVVEDEGPGFQAHILRRVFEPYVTTKPGGTGLGLPIVKKIVEEHGGRIEAGNRSASGGVVTILFRRLAPDTAQAAT